ncbi:MAG: hypothetical protein AB7E52_01805 [Bdellovibrionales bacterium]
MDNDTKFYVISYKDYRIRVGRTAALSLVGGIVGAAAGAVGRTFVNDGSYLRSMIMGGVSGATTFVVRDVLENAGPVSQLAVPASGAFLSNMPFFAASTNSLVSSQVANFINVLAANWLVPKLGRWFPDRPATPPVAINQKSLNS